MGRNLPALFFYLIMKKHFYPYLLIIILLSFQACEKEVDIDSVHPQKLCLNCILSPDSIVTANLVLSKDIENNYEFEPVNDATLILYTDEGFNDTLILVDRGRYSLNHKPVEGVRYSMLVLHKKFSNIQATAIVPHYTSVDWKVTDTIAAYPQENKYFVSVDIEIHDNPTEKNSYWMQSFETNAVFIDGFNRDIDTESKYGYVYYYYLRFSDKGYSGQTMRLTFERRSGDTRYVWSCDENYDKYLKSSLKARLNAEKDLPFREPVQIFSNIENGYGIFGAVVATPIKY